MTIVLKVIENRGALRLDVRGVEVRLGRWRALLGIKKPPCLFAAAGRGCWFRVTKAKDGACG